MVWHVRIVKFDKITRGDRQWWNRPVVMSHRDVQDGLFRPPSFALLVRNPEPSIMLRRKQDGLKEYRQVKTYHCSDTSTHSVLTRVHEAKRKG